MVVERAMMLVKQQKGCIMTCDVGEATKGCRMRQSLTLQTLHRFTYVTAHSPTFPPLYYITARSTTVPLLHLCHSSFSNPSTASSTSELILQPFCCFTYITAHSPTLLPLHLRHKSFYNPSVASPTSQALHVRHLVNCPCIEG